MLIQKPLDQGDIVSIKLLTGEEVLGRYVSETDTEIHVKKPCTLAMGNQGYGYCTLDDDNTTRDN